MAIIGAVILFDLLIKKYIVNNFEIGQTIFSIKGFLIVAKIEMHSISYGWKQPINYSLIINIIFQAAFLILFIRMLVKKVNFRFIIFSFMIISGWAGNYLDKLFFSTSSSYQQLDYLSFAIVSDAFTNISSLLSLVGWAVLVLAAIFKLEDFKRVFNRSGAVRPTNA